MDGVETSLSKHRGNEDVDHLLILFPGGRVIERMLMA